MRLINMTCPNCGSQLQIDLENKQAICQYCGNALFIDDGVQHIQYDNAEKAGYEFEKGRQRAQAEQASRQVSQTATVKYWQQPQPQKKNNTMVWWVLGWIFFFPIPLTILLARNKTMDPKVKYGIIAGMWAFLLLIGLINNAGKKTNTDTSSNSNTTETEISTEIGESSDKTNNESAEDKESDSSQEIQQIDESSYSKLMKYFSSVNQDIKADDVLKYCDDEAMSSHREDYSGGEYEIKIAESDDASKIKYNRTGGENIFFKFESDDTLSYAIYESSNNPSNKVLYFCKGDVFGWDSQHNEGKYYYKDVDTLKEVETPNYQDAFNGAYAGTYVYTGNEASVTDSDLEVIYDKDDGINSYLNKYNEANPEHKITSEDVFVYHHHGKDHDNQAKYYTDGFEIVITGGAQVYIGRNSGQTVKLTNDDYKEMFKRFVRGFEDNITDEQLEQDWNTLMEDLTNNVEFDGYKCDATVYGGSVNYMTITNK